MGWDAEGGRHGGSGMVRVKIEINKLKQDCIGWNRKDDSKKTYGGKSKLRGAVS